MIARLRIRLFERILNLPLDAFDRWRPGELMSRFSTDLQLMTDAVSVSVPQLVVALVTFVSSFAVMIYLDWLLTLSLIVVAPIVSFAVSKFQRVDHGQHPSRAAADRRSVGQSEPKYCKVSASSKRSIAKRTKSAAFETRNEDFFGAYMKLTQFIQTQPVVVSTIMVGRGRVHHVDVRERSIARPARYRHRFHVLGAAGQL